MTTGSRTRPPGHPSTSRLPGIAALVIGVALLIALTLLLAPGTATAATADPDARYYRSAVTAIEPAVPGLDVVVHGGGESITLTNRTGKPVVVLGYSGEPYLRIDPGGVQVNTNSLTGALNADAGRSAPDPALTAKDKPLPARWRPVGVTNSFTWTDFRSQWSAEQRPPIVTADPHARHQVFAWAIQLTVDGRPVLVRGAVTWTGAPWLSRTALLAVAGGVLLVVLVGTAVIASELRRRRLDRRTSHAIPAARSAEQVTHSTGAR